jgi:UrcA family protein
MKMATQKILQAALIGCAILAQTTPVFADPDSDLFEVKRAVRYGDLDLSSSQGQKQFETRIKAAVKIVCGDTSNASIIEKRQIEACSKQSMANAKHDADVVIAQYNNGRNLAAR